MTLCSYQTHNIFESLSTETITKMNNYNDQFDASGPIRGNTDVFDTQVPDSSFEIKTCELKTVSLVKNPNDDMIKPHSDQGIIHDMMMRTKSLKIYDHLLEQDKCLVDDTIKNVNEMLIFYKSMSYMYPDWMNCCENKTAQIDKSSHSIYREIGYYMMTHMIDDKYLEIPGYRKSINNPFHRGLWHMASIINFDELTISKKLLSCPDSLFGKFFKFLDVFCLLSRPKTRKEFESSYRTIYRCITSESDNNKIVIPFWIHDQYANKNITNLMELLSCKEIHSVTLRELDKNMFFFLLSDTFVTISIQIGSLNISDGAQRDTAKTITRKIMINDHELRTEKKFDSKSHRRNKQNEIYSFTSSSGSLLEHGSPLVEPDIVPNVTNNPPEQLEKSRKVFYDDHMHKYRHEKKHSNYSYVPTRTSAADISRNWRACGTGKFTDSTIKNK